MTYFEFTLFIANIGGWIKSPNQEVIDLELEEAVTSEDISQDQSFGPESPSTPQAPSKSQTKTYIYNFLKTFDFTSFLYVFF